jgi:hypothetical protein
MGQTRTEMDRLGHERSGLWIDHIGCLDFAANLVYEIGRFAHVRLGACMREVTLDEGSRQWVRLT